MKILHYVYDFSLPSETFIYDLINNLEEVGVDNYILSHQRQLEKERPFSKVQTISEKTLLYKKIYYRLLKRWKIRNEKDVVNYIRQLKPDVIHAHFGPNGIKMINLIKKHNLNIPLLVSFHGMDLNVLPFKCKKYLRYLLQMSIDKNVLFTSPSEFLKRKARMIGFKKDTVIVIPNAYNDYFYCAEKKSFWNYGDELKLLHIGRFEEVKGQKYLVEAFGYVREEYPNTTLTIIGYGSLENDLKRLCKKLNVQDNVKFLNQVKHVDLPNIIYEHDIYIQPSIIASDGAEENLSVSTIESQICGLPAIVSNIGGLKEIVIDGETGKLIEEKNSKQLSSAILFYVKNPEHIKIHSLNARKKANDRFNKVAIIKKVKECYEKI
jgi:glycosyltransferase involved in cell wall biosynthesis